MVIRRVLDGGEGWTRAGTFQSEMEFGFSKEVDGENGEDLFA